VSSAKLHSYTAEPALTQSSPRFLASAGSLIAPRGRRRPVLAFFWRRGIVCGMRTYVFIDAENHYWRSMPVIKRVVGNERAVIEIAAALKFLQTDSSNRLNVERSKQWSD